MCVKFNIHNFSNMPIAFIEQTMPTYMHNMPSCKHNVIMHAMSYINVQLQFPNMHAQYAIMHAQHILQTQHANMHAQNANMSYAHTTCIIHMQHAVMQTKYVCTKGMRTTATWRRPKIKVHG